MNGKDLVAIAKKAYSKDEVDRIREAAEFATIKHLGQMRASGKPYITHPLGVAKYLIDWEMDVNSIIAGVLHDTVEDTLTTLEEITTIFGPDVANLVEGLTKVALARSGMKDLGEYQKQTTDNLSKLLIATSNDIRVIIIKLADRLYNLNDLEFKSPAKQKKIARESLEVFAPMADRIGMSQVKSQIEDISFRFLEPKRYQQLHILTRKNLSRSTRKLGKIKLEVTDLLKANGIEAEIGGRVKTIYSLHKKMIKKDENIDGIHDLIALRIVVKTKEDCYRALGALHTIYQPMITRIKDYISVPKTNGYQSLHTTVITPHKQIVEFQIRTQEMHNYAERGLAASFHYNEQKLTKNYSRSKKASRLPANLQWIASLQEIAANLKDNEAVDSDQLAIDLFKDRIFVYSPKGDIFNLPENALPLDFAFMVHSKVGKHAYGFLVNNKITPFDKPLQNGDIVEVITKRSVTPKQEWLDLMTTTHAKHKLRALLKQAEILPPTRTREPNPKSKPHNQK